MHKKLILFLLSALLFTSKMCWADGLADYCMNVAKDYNFCLEDHTEDYCMEKFNYVIKECEQRFIAPELDKADIDFAPSFSMAANAKNNCPVPGPLVKLCKLLPSVNGCKYLIKSFGTSCFE